MNNDFESFENFWTGSNLKKLSPIPISLLTIKKSLFKPPEGDEVEQWTNSLLPARKVNSWEKKL